MSPVWQLPLVVHRRVYAGDPFSDMSHGKQSLDGGGRTSSSQTKLATRPSLSLGSRSPWTRSCPLPVLHTLRPVTSCLGHTHKMLRVCVRPPSSVSNTPGCFAESVYALRCAKEALLGADVLCSCLVETSRDAHRHRAEAGHTVLGLRKALPLGSWFLTK